MQGLGDRGEGERERGREREREKKSLLDQIDEEWERERRGGGGGRGRTIEAWRVSRRMERLEILLKFELCAAVGGKITSTFVCFYYSINQRPRLLKNFFEDSITMKTVEMKHQISK